MLEHFHVPEEDQVRVWSDDLQRTITAIFSAMGMPDDDAELAADGLVTADIRGCETHTRSLAAVGFDSRTRVAQRLRDGIPLHREVIEWFDSAIDELKLEQLVRVD